MNAKSKGPGWQDGSVVRAWAVLAQDPGSVPSGHVVSQDNYSFRASGFASGLHVHQAQFVHRHTRKPILVKLSKIS